jgi:hypothetical protein
MSWIWRTHQWVFDAFFKDEATARAIRCAFDERPDYFLPPITTSFVHLPSVDVGRRGL